MDDLVQRLRDRAMSESDPQARRLFLEAIDALAHKETRLEQIERMRWRDRNN